MSQEGRILTGADQLLSLVSEHNVLSLRKASSLLGCDPEQVRLLAESLEDYGKVVIYQTITDILIVDKDHYIAMSGSISGRANTFVRSLFSFGSKKRAVRFDAEEREKALDERASNLEKRSRTLEKRAEELDAQAASLARTHEMLEAFRAELDGKSAEIAHLTNTMRTRITRFEEEKQQLSAKEQRIRDSLDKARALFD